MYIRLHERGRSCNPSERPSNSSLLTIVSYAHVGPMPLGVSSGHGAEFGGAIMTLHITLNKPFYRETKYLDKYLHPRMCHTTIQAYDRILSDNYKLY